jgi:hypothetical protein
MANMMNIFIILLTFNPYVFDPKYYVCCHLLHEYLGKLLEIWYNKINAAKLMQALDILYLTVWLIDHY